MSETNSNKFSILKNLNFYLADFIANTDWLLIFATFSLLAIGLTTLTFSQPVKAYSIKQTQFAIVGICFMLAARMIPYKLILTKLNIVIFYIINLILLLIVMKSGHSAMGAQRWLSIGSITIQPSEIAKIVVIFTLAYYLGLNRIKSFIDIIKTGLIILLPAVLVFKQPDLGTSLTFAAVFMGMIYFAGATVLDVLIIVSPVVSLILNAISLIYWYYFIGGLGVILAFFWRVKNIKWYFRLLIITFILVANVGFGHIRPKLWGLLKDYQQKRLTSFINPYLDPRGSGYHLLQSLIAVGSGGLNGNGLGKGNQTQGAFIPERHTDFIYSVISEEMGFKVSLAIILLYILLCLRAIHIAILAKDEPIGSILCIGIMSMFLFHVFLNIGMTIGIMPVAGVPLPFLSYGGTALIVDLFSIGVLESVRANH